VWSGVAGWLLADQSVSATEVRPMSWVVGRAEPVTWSVPADSSELRLVVISSDSVAVGAADSLVVDSRVGGGGPLSTGVLPPGAYRYRVSSDADADADTDAGAVVTEGRFDVAAATDEMVPPPIEPAAAAGAGTMVAGAQAAGRPFRTSPWPYLLVIALLCGEWIGRRRSGLR
jgi:hypothetical protein